jgi:hypothetical protein
MKLVLAVIALAVACSSSHDGKPEASASPAAPSESWYPMGTSAAVPVPLGCSAQCTLDCDVWVGEISCPGTAGPIVVSGGTATMAAMALDEKTATVVARESLPSGASLRSGISPNGEFCADVAWQTLTWQLCTPDDPHSREVILNSLRRHRTTMPAISVLTCETPGC